MHYKNGREAKVGDLVVGTTYNLKGLQIGILVGITPGTDCCNCRVACVRAFSPNDPSNGTTGMVHSEQGVTTLVTMGVDYSACKDLYHAEDAFALLESVPQVVDPPPAASPA